MEIVYEDDALIAVNKPNGIFVHRTRLDPSASTFVLQIVRDMTGSRVYPVHRLDRKTSGLLLLAKSVPVQSRLNEIFRDRQILKQYLAIVRGFTPEVFTVNYALKNDQGNLQESITHFKTMAQVEIPLSNGKFNTSRYSLVSAQPETGRRHQIRRHLAHVLHPIIGDRPHGCNKQNKLFLAQFNMNNMLLHSSSLTFLHPVTGAQIEIKAPLFGEFLRMFDTLGFEQSLL